MDEATILLKNSNLDVLCLNETRTNSSISDIELEMESYNMLRADRDAGSPKRGGGVTLIYTRQHHAFEAIPNWNLCTQDVEWYWCKLNLKGTRPTFICLVYRSTSGELEAFLDLLESK